MLERRLANQNVPKRGVPSSERDRLSVSYGMADRVCLSDGTPDVCWGEPGVLRYAWWRRSC